MLKTDLHLHSHEDPYDGWFVKYSAKDLIRFAAKQKFDVLSLTLHNRVYFNQELKSFAKKKGILLIPGAEPLIERKDVLMINVTNEDLAKLKKLDDLEKMKDSALIIAPHPFFLAGNFLEGKLIKHIDKFHAIEFSHFYTRTLLNPFFKFIAGNPKAIAIAEKYHKPIIGTSDTHKLYEFGTTYTMVDAAKNKDDVLEAIKKNRVKLVTRPLPVSAFFRRIAGAVIKEGLGGSLIKKRKYVGLARDPFFKRFK